MGSMDQGKELKDLVPQLKAKLGYREALLELQRFGLSEATARKLLTRSYDSVPRSQRIIEGLEDCLAKHGVKKAS
jgi:hypothetical protein